ncbi:MAG: ABC transporter ATP-binding protein [Phycisphaerae bacterium]|nr:ABC transporter ATP-binding protein [Phycisphaerae bacterium]
MPLISAHNLHKTYRLGRVSVPVLHGASLAVEESECIAILGASGSGKSTLLHLLGGLDRPDASGPNADIHFNSRSLRAMSQRELNNYRSTDVGFVFQFYHLLPELTVLQNVTIAAMVRWGRFAYLRRRAEIVNRAESLLDRFGLASRLRHRPVELSGGERQRVAIARALINEPRLLLADEPTGNLDQATGATILDAIMGLRREHKLTMVLVTHDPATAARADRILHIRDGIVINN